MSNFFHKCWDLLDARTRRRLPLMLFLILVTTALEALGIGVIFPLVKLLTDPGAAQDNINLKRFKDLLGIDSTNILLIVISLGMVALFFIKNALTTFTFVLQMHYRRDAELALSCSLLHSYLTAPYALMLRRNSAELIANFTHNIPPFFSFVLFGSLRIISDICVVMAITAVLFALEPWMTLMVLGGFAAVLACLMFMIHRRLLGWGRTQITLVEERIRSLQYSFGALRDINISATQNFFISIFASRTKSMMGIQLRVLLARDFPRMAMEVIMISSMAVIIISMLLTGRTGTDIIAVLGIFGVASFRIVPQLNRIVGAISDLRVNLPAVERISADFRGFAKTQDTSAESLRLPFRHEIRLETVSYSYTGSSRTVLNDINLTIPYGTTIGLVGSSGAGKSTLADILLGLLTPTSGVVTVDGHDISTDVAAWQRNVATVPQDIFILDDTLRRNIAFGVDSSNIDDQRVQTALSLAQLQDLIALLDHGFDTKVGERGARLSGGQRQRLGMARALYRDPEVLVLDEATSALDVETERDVNRVLGELAGKRTIIIIAHRLSTVRNCDKIVFLSQGQIAGMGTFDELQKINKDFANMVRLSQGEVI